MTTNTGNMPVRTKDTQFINTIQELNNFCINNPSFFFLINWAGVHLYLNKSSHHEDNFI